LGVQGKAVMAQKPSSELTYEVHGPDRAQRCRELIIYIAEKCAQAEFFGSVKLNKILFHSDMRSFRKYGQPITGMKYQKLEHGPAPVGIKPLEEKMVEKKEITIRQEIKHGRTQNRAIPLRSAKLTLFSGRDIAIVDEVIHDLWGKTATQVSLDSHGIQWKTRALEDYIPYEAAYLSDEPITPADIERTTVLASKYGWASQ